MLRSIAWTAAVWAAAMAALAGCTTAPAWQRVEVPADFHPASVAAAGDGVLVGGRRGDAPLLVRVSGPAVTGTVDLAPLEPDAAAADLISVATDGDAVNAIGRHYGGAHSNPRLTVWDGTISGNLLTSRPQDFFTFGGHEAGNLLGTEVVGDTPVIFGLRSVTTGIEGLLWTRDGHTWSKHTDVDPSLVSNPDRVVGFGAIARSGDRLVVAGDEVGLAGGLTQRPALWVGGIEGPWQQVLLPVPDLPPVPGQLSRATGVACPDTGSSCWVAGWLSGRPVVWTATIADDGSVSATGATILPGTPPAGSDPVALVAVVAGRPVVSTGAAEPDLQLGCPDGWRTLPRPTGPVSRVVGSATGLYLITGDRLERLDAPSC